MMRRSPLKPGATPLKRTAFARKAPMPSTGMLSVQSHQRLAVSEPKRRTRKCALKTCRKPFQPCSTTHVACSTECAIELARLKRVAKDRKERQEGLAKLKRKADHIADCQKAFNAWVRFRDRNEPCIDCGRSAGAVALTGGAWDAGHYLSRGSHPHLRFDERNVFAQLKGCNRPGGATAASFRAGVVARIGLAAVEALEADNEPRRYTVEQLIAMTAHYKKLLKELKAAA